MAAGLREGDPKLKIGTCASTTGKSEQYAKSVECIRGLERLYDFLNIHTYAEAEGYPDLAAVVSRRPQDRLSEPSAAVDRLAGSACAGQGNPRDRVWLGCLDQAGAGEGTFAKWVGSTETEQARYLVRSFLLFSKYDVARAYIYFFDDKDEPQVHGSSGLTRNGPPKPAFHAVAHLQKTLGDYRFRRVVEGTTVGRLRLRICPR